MGKIVAIGGGETGRPGYDVETTEIDLEIKKMTGKYNPDLLFIPTATNDSRTYIDTVQNHFGKRIGCEITSLELHNQMYSYNDLEKQIFSADIIYVGGGNTKMMLSKWRESKLDNILRQAYFNTEIVLSGVSAGAICWFRFGSSDSERFENPNAKLICLPCLDLINMTLCPHYDVEEDRKPDFKELLKNTSTVGIGLDNCCALKIENDDYQIVTSKEQAYARVSQWDQDNYYEVKLQNGSTGKLTDLNSILSKLIEQQ